MYIWWLFKFVEVFFMESKIPKIFTKRPPVATTAPLGTQRHHWGIGIPGYTFGSSIRAQAIPPTSWGSASPVTTGSLQGLQWASLPSTLQKRRLNSLFMIVFWDYGQNGVLFDENFPFGRRINLACAICWMRCTSIPAYGVQRVKILENSLSQRLDYLFAYKMWTQRST